MYDFLVVLLSPYLFISVKLFMNSGVDVFAAYDDDRRHRMTENDLSDVSDDVDNTSTLLQVS